MRSGRMRDGDLVRKEYSKSIICN